MQLKNITSSFACLRSSELTLYLGINTVSRIIFSLSFPKETNVSVATISASCTALIGSFVTLIIEPVFVPSFLDIETIHSGGSYPDGQDAVIFIPVLAQPIKRSLHTLNPSPIHARFNPLNFFLYSRIVKRSAKI